MTQHRTVPILSTSITVVCLLMLCLTVPTEAAAQDTFVIVVHASNPVSTLSAEDVSKLFMKRVATWADGLPVLPTNLPADSQLRDRFSRQIHGKPAAPIVAYWQQQIFSGRGLPPVEKASESEVLRFVRQNRNAIGYVSATTEIGAGVKTLRVSDS
jgi:ABC-type phosphate transport system substrate-binding protein